MWNDLRAGILEGFNQGFLLFSFTVCNTVFGPHNTRSNYDSKTSFFNSWLGASSIDSPWFEEGLPFLAADNNKPMPQTRADKIVFLDSLKSSPSLSKMGQQPRMMSWFSLNESIKGLLPDFTLNMYGYRAYHERYFSQELVDVFVPVVGELAATADEPTNYKEELQRLRKGGNQISLAAKLMSLSLRSDMRIYSKVSASHWLFFGNMAKLKLSGKDNQQFARAMAMGRWYHPVRNSMIQSLKNFSGFNFMGVQIGPAE